MGPGSGRWCPSRRCATSRTSSSAICSLVPTTPRANALSVELATPITQGFEALVFKASRGIEDIYELTYIRKDGRRFPAVVSVPARRDAQNASIAYLLIAPAKTARNQPEE